MSQEIDQRVVEMRFDNAQFERNSRDTMRTLDKLKEKLSFKGAAKGLEQVQAASENVDFSGMEKGLDTVQAKFSALDVVAFTALQRITDKVISTGEQMVKSLSTDNITRGWDKYTEKTGNVQTIMNATGKSIDTVNGYLNKLMWYSDETSFSFNEMTSAISQATASGGDLKKMVTMVMGIANATADAGKSGYAFQSTIRNLIQSYSAGYLQLMDWKSLNLMGTGTKALKQELINTAVELGTIKQGDVTISTFESSLQKKWATTQVMEKTFAKYASMMEAAYDLTQKNPGMTSSEALEQLKGQYGDLAERAALAAQQAKSFQEAIDSTKDAVSSKWMNVFETLFGNKEEAVDTWTELANRLYDVFVPPIEALNDRMKEGLDSGWQQMRDAFGDQADAYTTVLEKLALAKGAVTEEAIEEEGSFAKALQKGKVNAELLTTSLSDTIKTYESLLGTLDKADPRYDAIQKDYEAFLKLNDAVADGSLDLAQYAEGLTEVSGREHLSNSLWNIWDAIAKVMGSVHEAFTEIFPPTSGEQIHSIAEGLDAVTKKLIISDEAAEKVKATFRGIFSVMRVIKSMVESVSSVFGAVGSAAAPLAGILLDVFSCIGKGLSGLTEQLHPFEAIAGLVTGFIEKLAPALYSFGASADKVLSSFAENAKNAFNEFDPEKMNSFITGGLGIGLLSSIKGFFDGIKSIGASAGSILKGVKEAIESLGEAVDAWTQAKKAETLLTIAKSVGIIATSLTVLSMIDSEKLAESIGTMTVVFAELLGVMKVMAMLTANTKSLKMAALAGGMVTVATATLILAGALKIISTIDKDKMFASVIALGAVMAELTAVGAIFSKIGGRFIKGAAGMVAFSASVGILAGALKPLSNIKSDALAKGLVGIAALCGEMLVVAKLMNGVRFGIGKGTGFVLLASSINLMIPAFNKIASLQWENIGKGLIGIGGALAEFVAALSLTKGTLGGAASLMIMAASVNLLVPAIRGLSELSLSQMGTALLAVAGAFTAIGVAAVILAPVTPVIVALSVSLSALALSIGALLALNSAAMFIGNLASSLTLLQNLNFQVFLNGLKAVAWMLVEFIAGVIKGIGEIAGALVVSISNIITAICNALVLAAPAIGETLYVVGTVVIDTLIKLIAYIWEKSEPALNDLWEKFKAWLGAKGQEFDLLSLLGLKWENPFTPFLDELKNGNSVMAGIYQLFAGNGKDAADGYAEGIQNGTDEVKTAAGNMAKTAADSTAEAQNSHSPSKVFEELGRYCLEGYAIGIEDQSLLERLKGSMQTVARSIRNVFTTFWGIHSPSDLSMSDAKNILEGAILGMSDEDARQRLHNESYNAACEVKDAISQALDEALEVTQNKMTALYDAMRRKQTFGLSSGKGGYTINGIETPYEAGDSKLLFYDSRYDAAKKEAEKALDSPILIPGKNGLAGSPERQNSVVESVAQQVLSGKMSWTEAVTKVGTGLVSNLKEKLGGALGLPTDSKALEAAILSLYEPYLPDDTSTDTSSGKKSSGKTKTLAETIAEKYTKELKANKYLQNAADKEYSLWEAGEGDTASIEALIEKKGETLAKSIELQTARVDIAQRQYDELVSRVGAGDDKTKEAYNTLLDEKKNLLDLQQAKFENTYKTALERYESDDKVAQSEYQLWADTYKKTALAEKAWVETKDALGEASLVTQQAYRDYLEARQEQLELENELDKAQLAAFDNLSSFYDSRISMAQKRMNLLDKLYNDGDLSGRADAYASAVEQYGEDSIEARRAATQGTMTALMGVNSALTSMRWQMSKVTAMQQKYQTALEQAGGNRYDETVMAAYEDMMETRSTFADYVGNLADAFNVSDATKKAMMQFGDAIAQNWKPIQNGFMAVAKKMNPKLVQGFSDLFGLYMKDGASETVAAATNTVVAAMSGDWASAVASGLTAVLDVVGTDFGQTLTEAISTALKNAFSGNGLFAQLLTKLFGRIDLGGSGSSGNFLSTIWQWLKGGASAAKSFLGGASKAAAGASGAAKLIPVLEGVGTGAKGAAVGAKTAAKALGLAGKAVTTVGTKAAGILGTVGGGIAKVAASLGPHGLLIGAVLAGTVAVGTVVVKNWDKVKEAVGNAWSWIKEKASGLWDGMKSIGGNIMSGLATGVKSAAKFGLKVALSPAYAIISGFKHILGIHSPSKVMAGIGEYIIEGLTRGIVSTEGEAEKGMDEVGNTVLSSALATTKAISDYLSTDNHPSITPVVDLSDAARGSAWLNSAFADRKGTISMAATVTGRMARRAETPSRNQNGYETAPAQTQTNREVVEAVTALGERIDRVAESVKGMKVVMNGHKLVGEIKSDINDAVGDIIEKGW